jgi:ferredoxin-type protein NapH
LQSLLAGHAPEATAITGALIVLVFYLLVAGRVYCSWVCPVNIVTDAAHWLRERLGIVGASRISRNTRYWVLGATSLLALLTGSLVWELLNPVSMLHRGLIFGMGLAWSLIAAVFLLDFLVSRRAWCGHLCPMGAFYSLLATRSSPNCTNCGRCIDVCSKDVFRFGSRFNNRSDIHERRNHSPPAEVL